ncbi:MAG: hypothetical protein EWV47_17950 [Microcystis viridis Mv_BB_P_19951000_S68]|nr:MAG: hypothetical protein EWV47_17950 [Microcystis viridis Mv_BB_P_19951000_S68]
MKMQGFEPRFSQNLAPVSLVKPQNPYFAFFVHKLLIFVSLNSLEARCLIGFDDVFAKNSLSKRT